MKPYEKIFRNSLGRLFEPIFVFFILSFFTFISIFSDYGIYIRIIFGIVWMVIAFFIIKFISFFVRCVKVTDEEITVQKLFGTKSFRWDDIERVSRRGEYLFFHNRDGNATLSIGSQMNGYAELLDLFFKKHSRLFKAVESEFISRGRYDFLAILFFVLLLIGLGLYSFRVSEWFYGVVCVGCGIYALFIWPRTPQSITLLDDVLLVNYPFREASYYARWIKEVTLGETKSWGQVSHFVKINLRMGNSIDLRIFPHNGLLTYRNLKRWHEKALAKEIVQSS